MHCLVRGVLSQLLNLASEVCRSDRAHGAFDNLLSKRFLTAGSTPSSTWRIASRAFLRALARPITLASLFPKAGGTDPYFVKQELAALVGHANAKTW